MDRIFKGLRDPPRQILRNYPARHSFKTVITNRFSLCSWKVCHFLAATIEPQPSRSLTKTWHRWWILVYTLCFDDFNRENVVQFVARRASLSIQLGTAVANRFSAVWFFGELFFSFSSSPEASIITRLIAITFNFLTGSTLTKPICCSVRADRKMSGKNCIAHRIPPSTATACTAINPFVDALQIGSAPAVSVRLHSHLSRLIKVRRNSQLFHDVNSTSRSKFSNKLNWKKLRADTFNRT